MFYMKLFKQKYNKTNMKIFTIQSMKDTSLAQISPPSNHWFKDNLISLVFKF